MFLSLVFILDSASLSCYIILSVPYTVTDRNMTLDRYFKFVKTNTSYTTLTSLETSNFCSCRLGCRTYYGFV